MIVGPHMENFREIAEQFLAEGALVQVPDAEALGRTVADLLVDEPRRRALGAKARSVVESNRGALAGTLDRLHGLGA